MKIKNITIIINILIFCVLAFIFALFNMNLPLSGTDCFHIYQHTYLNALSFESTRIPPYIISKLYSFTLPKLFNLHPADFRADYLVCTIMSFLYVSFSVLFSRGFYLLFDKEKKYLERFETIILLPITFICTACYLLDFTFAKQLIFLGVEEVTVFAEELLGFILYLPFFTKIFDIIINDGKINKKFFIIYFLIGLLLGLWSEFINIPTFFTLLIIICGLFIFKIDKIKNKSLWVLISGFLLGFFIFYIVSGNFNLTNFGTIQNFNILNQNLESFSLSNDFYRLFFKMYIKDFKYLWIILFISTILAKILCCFISSEKKNKINYVILLSFSLIFGYLLCSFSSILVDKSLRLGFYLFELFLFPYLGYLTILLSITNITGAFYTYSNITVKRLLSLLFLFFLIYSFKGFLPEYKNNIERIKEKKVSLYNFEKKIILYSVFGEKAILKNKDLPESSNCDNIESLDLIFRYINFNYKHNYMGIQNADDKYADSEIKKREKIFGTLNDEYNIFHVIKYAPIKKYDNIILSFEKINELEKQNGKNDIYTKAKAYLYLKQKNYDKALNLYDEYIKNNPKDLEAQIQRIEIYKIKNKTKVVENLYKELHNKYKDNVCIMLDMVAFYYYENNMKKALKMIDKIINVVQKDENIYSDIIPVLYYQQAIIYKQRNDKEKSKECYNKIRKDANLYWFDNGLNTLFNYDFDFFYNNDEEYMFLTSNLFKQI